MHARHAALGNQRAGGVRARQARYQQAGRALQQLLAQQQFFFVEVVVRHAHQRLVTGRAQAALHGFKHIDEQRV